MARGDFAVEGGEVVRVAGGDEALAAGLEVVEVGEGDLRQQRVSCAVVQRASRTATTVSTQIPHFEGVSCIPDSSNVNFARRVQAQY